MSHQLSIDESTAGAHTVLAVTGEIDLATAPQLEARIGSHPGDGNILLDLSDVAFMDSTGLRLLIGAHERAKNDGGTFAVVAPEGPVTKVLSITGVDEWLPVFETRAAATTDG
ncbi:MAG: STAS domain-containing protein [Acidimicrobiia bacterium]|nr:STAS domain-containing protein [Acidimicrobiia bacterium]